MSLPLRFALALFLCLAALIDLRTRKVPNWLVLPLLGLGALYSAIALRSAWFLLPWTLSYALWSLGAFGAGDAKLLMALFAFTPPMAYSHLALCLAVGMAGAGLVVGWRDYGGLQPFLLGTLNVLQGRVNRRLLLDSAKPFTWAFSLGGLCFLLTF